MASSTIVSAPPHVNEVHLVGRLAVEPARRIQDPLTEGVHDARQSGCARFNHVAGQGIGIHQHGAKLRQA